MINLDSLNIDCLFCILGYCDDSIRSNFVFLSKYYHSLLVTDESFIWRLRRLHNEHGVHSPSVLLSDTKSWKEVFIRMRKLRYMWEKDDENKVSKNQSPATFHISVCARFRPKRLNNSRLTSVHDQNYKPVTLPLHQRLSIIKVAKNVSSNKEAMKILNEQGDWFRSKVSKELEGKENVDFETNCNKKAHLTGGIHTIDFKNCSVIVVDPIKGLCEIKLDHVLSDTCSQQSVYETSTMGLVSDFINGYDVSCLVYGQTGSGKTYTMFGEDKFLEECNLNVNKNKWGIVPRACLEVLEAMEYRKNSLNFPVDSNLNVTYVEVFGESVSDLLRKGARCGNNKVSAQRFVLDGSSEVRIESFQEALALLNEGESQKRKAATAMNDRSSRAHTIFILTLNQHCPTRNIRFTSRLFLVDLGGSEQLKKSIDNDLGMKKTMDGISTRNERLKEAVSINLGLLALKQCVEKLNRNSNYIPYADSKLTMLLSPGLGGNSKTAMIVCAAQETEHCAETVSAIKFGRTCRRIKKHLLRDKTKLVEDIITQINTEIKECEENIRQKERWEIVERSHINRYGETEIKKTTILTGADDYRERLESLLRKKRELTGFSEDVKNEVQQSI